MGANLLVPRAAAVLAFAIVASKTCVVYPVDMLQRSMMNEGTGKKYKSNFS